MTKKMNLDVDHLKVQSFVTELKNEKNSMAKIGGCTAHLCTYPPSVMICPSDCLCAITHDC